MRKIVSSAFVTLSILVAANVRADRGEWRFSLAGTPGFIDMQQSGGDASGSPVWGSRVHVAYGISDHLEVGGNLGITSATGVHFSNAMVQGLRSHLYGDLYAFELAPTVRVVSPPLVHTSPSALLRPLLDLRAGLLVRTLSSQEAVLYQNGMTLLVGKPDMALSPLPFVGAAGGIEWRFADVYAIGLAGDFVYAGDGYTGVGVVLEVNWLTFARP
jgi:hypothetical protein